jgi:hypothetical protein
MSITNITKYHLYTVLFALISIYGIAQPPVLTTSIYNQGKPELNDVQWVYYKDFDNDLEPFVGVYELVNNHFSWKIELRRKLMSKSNWEYEDVIFGEYQYKMGNIVLYNSLPNIETAVAADYPWEFSSIGIGSLSNYPDNLMCPICTTNGEKFLRIYMEDEVTKRSCILIMRLVTASGQAALEVAVYYENVIYRGPDVTPALPASGVYTLLKQ